jgi:ABC-type phosphate/phosphonate transport system substrate-binding protein
MVFIQPPLRHGVRWIVLGAVILAAILALPLAVIDARQGKVDVLHIGTSGTLTPAKDQEKGALETLKSFIKDETGFNNDISRQKDWRELADKMAKGELHLGVFQGYEFAWAQKGHADLKPLALAVNVYRYPVTYVVTRKEDEVKDFAGLQGKSIYMPETSQPFLRLFVEHQTQALGKEPKDFFSKITSVQNVEDALDDLVDGMIQAAAVDRAALEAFRQRKPGRFNKLKEVAKSQPFPPVLIAYYDKVLDDATLRTFREGLLGASKKEKGKTVLTLFRLSGFDPVPEDFDKVLADTLKEYPPPKAPTK